MRWSGWIYSKTYYGKKWRHLEVEKQIVCSLFIQVLPYIESRFFLSYKSIAIDEYSIFIGDAHAETRWLIVSRGYTTGGGGSYQWFRN